jgi:hypothetical protein
MVSLKAFVRSFGRRSATSAKRDGERCTPAPLATADSWSCRTRLGQAASLPLWLEATH